MEVYQEIVTRLVQETEMIRSGSWSTEGQKRIWREGGRTVREFTGGSLRSFFRRNCSFLVLGSMPPRMRRWTQTVMRRRMKFWTFINRRAK